MAMLEVKHIEKHFGDTKVLNDISFSLEQGDVVSIIGSSGSGKTTLLRCLNFLERADGGSIAVNGETLFNAGDRSAQSDGEIRKRRLHFGLVFQSFNLFPQYQRDRTSGTAAAHSDGSGRSHVKLPPPALRRTAAAGGHRQSAGPGAGHSLL